MEAQLLEKNYKRFEDSFYNSLGLYKKKLNVDGEDLYINFYKYNTYKQHNVGLDKDDYEVKIQVELGSYTVNFDMFSFNSDVDVSFIEEEVISIYKKIYEKQNIQKVKES